MQGASADRAGDPDRAAGTAEKHIVRPNAPEVLTVTMHEGLAERVYVLEAKDEIRRLMAAYVHARDFGNSSIDDYFTDDAVWEGVDEQVRRRWPDLADNILAPQVGRDAIVKRFAGALPPVLHLLANESITVNGDDAVGYWTYLQPSVLGGRAYWVAGRYHIDFRREDGRWRIRHLQVQGIFEVPYDQGWAQAEFFQR
jgi:hypothetical protein